jgi:hypothetical protein
MSITVGKTWNKRDAHHDLVDGVLRISMDRDIKVLLINYGMMKRPSPKTPRRHLKLIYSSLLSFRTKNSLAAFCGLLELANRIYIYIIIFYSSVNLEYI